MSWQMHFLRNTSKDTIVYDMPPTLYTDSTTLTTGMTLYNNTGRDTGKVIGTINQDGSFEPLEMYYCWVFNTTQLYEGSGQGYGYVFTKSENPIVGDIVYIPTDYQTIIETERVVRRVHTPVEGIFLYASGDGCGHARNSTYDTGDILATMESIYWPNWSGNNYWSCLTGDTTVTLASGEYKRIDEIELGDIVLCINTDTLEFDEDEVVYTDAGQTKTHSEYDIWTFSNDYQVKTVHRHRFYNVESNSFKYMDEWKIGEHTINQDGRMLELLSHENVQEEVQHFKISTANYHNYFANQMLTGSRFTKNFDYKDLHL